MLSRLKRLWELSGTTGEFVTKEAFELPTISINPIDPGFSIDPGIIYPLTEPKPKGEATIIDITEPFEEFENSDAEHEGQV